MRRLLTILGCCVTGPVWAEEWVAPPRLTLGPVGRPAGELPPAGGVPWSAAKPESPTWSAVPSASPVAQVVPPRPVPILPEVVVPRPQARGQSTPLAPPQPVPGVPPAGAAAMPTVPAPPPPPVVVQPVPLPPACPPPASSSPLWGAAPFQNQPVTLSNDLGTGGHLGRGVYGSPNITLSRDYRLLDLFGTNLLAEPGDTMMLGDPAGGGFLDHRGYVELEYLLWWVNAGRIPVLASTSAGPMPGLGFLGMPGTQLLLGPGAFGSTARNGFRVRAGGVLDSGLGLEGSFFTLGRRSGREVFDSSVFPTIARPIFAPNFNQEFAELVAFPGLASGTLQVDNSSEIWGADLNAKLCLDRSCDSHAEIFAGYRHLNLRESLVVTEFIRSGPDAPDPVGTNIVVQDSFRTANKFHGAQVGYSFGRQAGRFEWAGRASLAMGVTNQQLAIRGVQNRTRPGEPTQTFATGGLLAAGPNIGNFSRNEFSVVPEATLTLGYRITPRAKVSVGYNFIYWTNVLRPGDQIDRVVDLTFVPNSVPGASLSAIRPLPTFRQSDLAIQGLQFGLELDW